jgi:hypothetical protein
MVALAYNPNYLGGGDRIEVEGQSRQKVIKTPFQPISQACWSRFVIPPTQKVEGSKSQAYPGKSRRPYLKQNKKQAKAKSSGRVAQVVKDLQSKGGVLEFKPQYGKKEKGRGGGEGGQGRRERRRGRELTPGREKAKYGECML